MGVDLKKIIRVELPEKIKIREEDYREKSWEGAFCEGNYEPFINNRFHIIDGVIQKVVNATKAPITFTYVTDAKPGQQTKTYTPKKQKYLSFKTKK